MQDFSQPAIESTSKAQVAYCKFIMPNDTGATGGHQSGYHIHKSAYSLVWDTPRERGTNDDKWITINWQDSFERSSRFIYYGQGTRDEYRLTNFGRGFTYLQDDSIGSLLVLCRMSGDFYKAYVLSTEDEIENYLNAFSISISNANGIVSSLSQTPATIEELIRSYVTKMNTGFPVSGVLSEKAREIFNQVSGMSSQAINDDPDLAITSWYGTEYSLFQEVEKKNYATDYLSEPFSSVETLVDAANSILNRRKSRAGKSLENHIAKIFDINKLPYSAQKVTEGNKKPDFIMPSIELYHDAGYSADKLVFLGVKTTCKDRWRQILNEAARTPQKHLFTLQPGISKNQLDEMKDEGVTLVVPKSNINTFPPESREDLLTLKNFIGHAGRTIS